MRSLALLLTMAALAHADDATHRATPRPIDWTPAARPLALPEGPRGLHAWAASLSDRAGWRVVYVGPPRRVGRPPGGARWACLLALAAREQLTYHPWPARRALHLTAGPLRLAGAARAGPLQLVARNATWLDARQCQVEVWADWLRPDSLVAIRQARWTMRAAGRALTVRASREGRGARQRWVLRGVADRDVPEGAPIALGVGLRLSAPGLVRDVRLTRSSHRLSADGLELAASGLRRDGRSITLTLAVAALPGGTTLLRRAALAWSDGSHPALARDADRGPDPPPGRLAVGEVPLRFVADRPPATDPDVVELRLLGGWQERALTAELTVRPTPIVARLAGRLTIQGGAADTALEVGYQQLDGPAEGRIETRLVARDRRWGPAGWIEPGRYAFDAAGLTPPSGRCLVWLRAGRNALRWAVLDPAKTPRKDWSMDLRRTTHLVGRVRTPDGKDPDVWRIVWLVPLDDEGQPMPAARRWAISARVEKDGSFDLPGLLPGRYRLVYERPTRPDAPSHLADLTLEPGRREGRWRLPDDWRAPADPPRRPR